MLSESRERAVQGKYSTVDRKGLLPENPAQQNIPFYFVGPIWPHGIMTTDPTESASESKKLLYSKEKKIYLFHTHPMTDTLESSVLDRDTLVRGPDPDPSIIKQN